MVMKSFRNWYEAARADEAKRQPPVTSKVFMFAYDLRRKPPKDYTALEKALRDAGAVDVLQSTWLLRADARSAVQVLGTFQHFLDDDDKVLVVELGRDRVRFLAPEYETWIDNNLPTA
jgi:hypothetical protein